MKKLKIGLVDIETAPLLVFCWGIQGPQFISLNQIVEDWSILSYSIKELGKSQIIYRDTSKQKNPRDDKKLVIQLRKDLEPYDYLIYQNGDRFDWKKIQARIIYHDLEKLPKPRSFDTYKVGKKEFGFTSHKLEYMCEHLNLKFKKLKSKKFVGMDLWRACLNKVKAAWVEMQTYNIHDTLALESLYLRMRPYGPSIDYDMYSDTERGSCPTCGSHKLKKRGYHTTKTGKFQKFSCTSCFSWSTGKENLISLDDRKGMKKKL